MRAPLVASITHTTNRLPSHALTASRAPPADGLVDHRDVPGRRPRPAGLDAERVHDRLAGRPRAHREAARHPAAELIEQVAEALAVDVVEPAADRQEDRDRVGLALDQAPQR